MVKVRDHLCRAPLCTFIALACCGIAAWPLGALAAPPPGGDALPVVANNGGLGAGLGLTGCNSLSAGQRGLFLCDQQVHQLTDPGPLDVVRVAYGTSLNATDFNIVSEVPTSGAGFYSPITIFSDVANAYGPATATFMGNTRVVAPPQSGLALLIATTNGTLNLGTGTTITEPAGMLAAYRAAALAAFGGGTINADGVTVNMPVGMVWGAQISNTSPGGGLPGSNALASLNLSNSSILVGNGIPGSSRAEGVWVSGEASANVTHTQISAGNYAAGVYTGWATSSTGFIGGARSTLDDVDITLGNDSVGLWPTGIHAAVTANNTDVVVGTGSWGAYVGSGATLTLTDTRVTTGADSYGLAVDGLSVARITGGSINTPDASSSAVSLDGAAAPTAATFNGTTVSAGGAAVTVTDSTTGVTFTGGANVTGTAQLFTVTGSQVNISAANATTLKGDALADASSTANLVLSDRTLWTGAAHGWTNVGLDTSSAWVVNGASDLTGTLQNQGIVEFEYPQVFDLVVHNYAGNEGILLFNTELVDDTGRTTRLVVDGGTATGHTYVVVRNLNGLGAPTTGDGIQLVQARNGATSTSTAFVQEGRIAAGAYDYALRYGGIANPNDQSWYLRSGRTPEPVPDDTPETPATDTPLPPLPNPNADPDPGTPSPAASEAPAGEPVNDTGVRREVALYTTLPNLSLRYGAALMDTLHTRIGDEDSMRGRANLDTFGTPDGVWARAVGVSGDKERYRYAQQGPDYNYDLQALQVGVELYRSAADQGARSHAGLYGATGTLDATVAGEDYDGAGQVRSHVTSFGGYWTQYFEGGVYLDAVLQYSRYTYDTTSLFVAQYVTYPGLQLAAREPRVGATIGNPAQVTLVSGQTAFGTKAKGYAASLESGWPFHPAERWAIEPQAQVSWQRVSTDAGNDPYGRISFDAGRSLLGRAGVRVARTSDHAEGESPLIVWARYGLWHEFRGDSGATVRTLEGTDPATFDDRLEKTWQTIDVGADFPLTKSVSLYGGFGVRIAESGGDHTAGQAEFGFRAVW